MTDNPDVLVIGAGVAGLVCARELRRNGRSVLVLDKGRSVGGRCATWRTGDGHRLDYGVTFFHGSDPAFLAEVDQLDGIIEGWPRRIRGRGDPCQPRALEAHERRVGIAAGAFTLAKHLAQDLDAHTGVTVESLALAGGKLKAHTKDAIFSAPDVVLAMPCEQARELLAPLSRDPEVDGTRRLLAMLGTVPCLAVLATYDHAPPDWHLMLPETSRIIQLVANESSKRPDTPGCALVIQARASWSADHLEAPPDRWAAELLREAGDHIEAWATQPTWSRAHGWRFARTDLATELAGPILVERDEVRLGLAGELFSRGAGVEAAYMSGRALAGRLASEGKA